MFQGCDNISGPPGQAGPPGGDNTNSNDGRTEKNWDYKDLQDHEEMVSMVKMTKENQD